jgi:hypothetical protein
VTCGRRESWYSHDPPNVKCVASSAAAVPGGVAGGLTRPGAIVGMDFFTVEVVTWFGLVRCHVLFAIDIASRKVEFLGRAVNPGGAWMEQIARNLVDGVDGFLLGKRYVLLDRDPLHSAGEFRHTTGLLMALRFSALKAMISATCRPPT